MNNMKDYILKKMMYKEDFKTIGKFTFITGVIASTISKLVNGNGSTNKIVYFDILAFALFIIANYCALQLLIIKFGEKKYLKKESDNK